ncbi:tyrosine-type recombinase/integrase [Leuconostoc citreum]
MASIYKRGKTWTANVFIIQDGKRKRKTKSGFDTKTQANKWAIGVENQKINHELSKKDGIIADMFDEWYEIFKEPQLETKSKAWYKAISQIIRKYWDNKKLSEITSADFQKLINEYGDNHVRSSVAHVKNIISAFVRYAVDEDFISKDFTRNAKTYGSKKSKDNDLKFLENDELENLIQSANESDTTTSHMILLAAYSGARYAEIAGLTKKDFDFKKNTININKSWQADDKAFKSTKTKTSNRIIDIPGDVMNLAKGWTFGQRYAFESLDGLPPSNKTVNKQLRWFLEQNGSKIITFHGLRHTHASYLLSKDIAIQYVSERLGHADVNITLSVYTHLLDKKRNLETKKALAELEKL